MDNQIINVRKQWPCPNTDCGANLGTVVNGELVIDLTSVVNISTNGANVELLCKCGRTKTWYAKEAAVAKAYREYEHRGIARALQEMTTR